MDVLTEALNISLMFMLGFDGRIDRGPEHFTDVYVGLRWTY